MSVDEELKKYLSDKKILIPSLSNFTMNIIQNPANIKRYIIMPGLITKREKRATHNNKE